MHRLKVVGAEHQDHQRQRRVDFNPLLQAGHAVASGLEGVVPHRAAAVQTILDDARLAACLNQLTLEDPGPAAFEHEPLRECPG